MGGMTNLPPPRRRHWLLEARCASAVRVQRSQNSTLTFWCAEPQPTTSLTTKARMTHSICITTKTVTGKVKHQQDGSLVAQSPTLPQPPTWMVMENVAILVELARTACCHPKKPCGNCTVVVIVSPTCLCPSLTSPMLDGVFALKDHSAKEMGATPTQRMHPPRETGGIQKRCVRQILAC